MKHDSRKVLLLSALLSLSSVYVRAEPVLPLDAVTRLEITKPLDTASEDDYLLDLARTGNVNFIVDASDFLPPSPIKGYPARSRSIAGQKEQRVPKFINLMLDFMAQEKLSILRAEARTFLFWSEPDARQLLASQMAVTQADSDARFAESVAVAKADSLPEGDTISGAVSGDQLNRVLSEYLKNEHGWSGTAAERNVPVDIRMQFDDLPPGMRALALLDMQQHLSSIRHLSSQEEDIEYLRASKEGDIVTLKAEFRNATTKEVNSYRPVFVVFNEADAPIEGPPVITSQESAKPIQTTPRDTLFNVYSGISDGIKDLMLDADTTLGKTISLSVKRVPLRDLVTRLSQQTGVKLTTANDAPSTKLVTAQVDEMPLSKFMGILSRMYGVTWSRGDGGTYTMHGNDQGELHLKLLQIGDPEWYRLNFELYTGADRQKENAAIGRAIVQQLGLEVLQKPEGVAVSALPQPLQDRFKNAEREPYLDQAPKMLYQTNRLVVEQLAKKGLVLRFGNSISKSYHTPFHGFVVWEPSGRICFNIQSEDGQVVMPAFEDFSFYTPTPGEMTARPLSRRR